MEDKEIKELYTEEELFELAKKQLLQDKNNNDSLEFSIKKVDKEYKNHNKKAITRAVLNGGFVVLFTAILLRSNSNLSTFGSEDLINLVNDLNSKILFLPYMKQVNDVIYPFTFGLVNNIIDKVGIIGLILSIKSIKLIITSIKDSKKAMIMKNELDMLQIKLEEVKNMEGNHVR
jgi:hypothetical protein